jgi:hypothetical protein
MRAKNTSLIPVDIALFLRALVIARHAEKVKKLPVPEVVSVITGPPGGFSNHRFDRLDLASRRAVALRRRWLGGIDTCLVRSLVLGGMLRGNGEVELCIGFRPGDKELPLDGHAWVTVDGRPVGRDGALAREGYTRVLTVPFLQGMEEE